MLLFIFVYFIFVIINNRVLNQKARKQFKWANHFYFIL